MNFQFIQATQIILTDNPHSLLTVWHFISKCFQLAYFSFYQLCVSQRVAKTRNLGKKMVYLKLYLFQ